MKSIEDGSDLKCDDDNLKQEDDCNNGSVCSKGSYCIKKEKGVGSKYLCSPFMNPVICNDGRFSCPSNSRCTERQKKCRDIDGNLTNQIMNPALQFLELVDKNTINLFNEFITKYSQPKVIKEKVIKEKVIKEKVKTKYINKIAQLINEINDSIANNKLIIETHKLNIEKYKLDFSNIIM